MKIGDYVEIIPGGMSAKVRGLQSHGKEVTIVKLGDRAAINLQGVDKDDIKRGSQLATLGYFQAVTQMGVKLRLLRSSSKPIIQNQRIRIYIGTQESMARIVLIDNKTLRPGDECPGLIRLESTVVASRGDKFIIRSYSPIITIGGGEIIDFTISFYTNENPLSLK